MRYLLINPPWTFEGSIYFGCREPHLPLEFGYAKALLEREGHDVEILDGQLDALSLTHIRERALAFAPDFTVLTTAPSYLFWRCAPPELRVPRLAIDAVRDAGGTLVIVGPHASTTPRSTLQKLDADVAILGECEDILPRLSSGDASATFDRDGNSVGRLVRNSTNLATLPALRWKQSTIAQHRHHHHRFDAPPGGPGAEMETSRGCPYHCTFCAKDNFRDKFRRRPIPIILDELDALIEQGVEYVYFIDEIFLPNAPLLEALELRDIRFGVQTRIDLWTEEQLELLGRAGCVSLEGGVESLTESGRAALDKRCNLTTEQLTERLAFAKRHIAFVQANLLDSEHDDPDDVERWRADLLDLGVWANKPVPLFPYPGSPEYTRRWGEPDDRAWERADQAYLGQFDDFSDVQEQRPQALVQLEAAAIPRDTRHES